MANEYEIRADFDQHTIVVYQAYNPIIANSAVKQQRFVSPFSFNRMTWIKPSFLWLMHRSQWGRKKGQENILAIRMKRMGWDSALKYGVLTHPEPGIYQSPEIWRSEFDRALVHIQWDTERSLKGKPLNQFSIQVGLSRHIIREFVDDWIVEIQDITPRVCKIRDLVQHGKVKQARAALPSERQYQPPLESCRKLMVNAF
ncbi:MAG: DUF4291 domain-containing protein [Planctomycetaceae bacterium]|nr:DUF4291 domain-containing protein [Planctomycetaceae bacterium]